MGLEETFGKVEKPAKEKKLEVIASVDAVVDDLLAYFEQNKYEYPWSDCKDYLDSCMDFLKSFELKPEVVSEFNKKRRIVKGSDAFGVYLSAMIQTSYNQGFNDFKFGKIDAKYFGAFLQGQPENPIRIEIKKGLKGHWSLDRAKNCSLTTKKLEGYGGLFHANGCLAEIQNYEGKCFGTDMKNCTIKSSNLETLETIKKESDKEGNRFELKK